MGEHTEPRGQGRSAGPRRFVLLCAPGAPSPPESLRRAIASRDAEIVLRSSPYQAMADLVEHERAFLEGHRPGALVLIIIDPARLPHAEDLADAAARHTPHSVVWRFSASADPPLAAFPTPPPRDSSPAPTHVQISPGVADTILPRHTQTPKPRLRLAVDDQNISHNEGDRAEDGQDGDPEPHRPVLTEQELEMLLSDDWERQTGEGGSA